MTKKNDRLFEKLDDDTLYNVSGGLEINKPLNTVVVSNELNNEKSTESNKNNDKQLYIPEKKLPGDPFDGIDKGLIK